MVSVGAEIWERVLGSHGTRKYFGYLVCGSFLKVPTSTQPV